MNINTIQYEDFTDALMRIKELLREASQQGCDVLHTPLEYHVNPGDVFDAYEATGLKPTDENILTFDSASPLGVIIMERFHPETIEAWWQLLKETFPQDYVDGFQLGFCLQLPKHIEECEKNIPFMRGVYDGVMARAAVY